MEKNINRNVIKSTEDLSNEIKNKMLDAIAKKQKDKLNSKAESISNKSKIGVGQLGSVTPKMHRRKSGSA